MNKKTLAEKRQLAIAAICSAGLAYLIVNAFNQPLAEISYHANDRWGSGYSATGVYWPIGLLALGAYFSWRGYFEDRRIRLSSSAKKNQGEVKQHTKKSNEPSRTEDDKPQD